MSDDVSKDEAKEQADYSQAKPKGIVIPADKEEHIGNLRGSAVTIDDLVMVDEDVWQEYYQEGSKRPSHRLVAAAGSVVAKNHLDRLGVKVKSTEQDDTAVHDFAAGHPLQTDALNPTDDNVAKAAEKKLSGTPVTAPAGGTQKSGRR